MQDDKAVEQIFGSSIDLLAILIAVAGLVITAADRVSGISYKIWKLEYLLWGVGALSALAAVTALFSLARLNGHTWMPRGLVLFFAVLLIVTTSAATICFIGLS